MPAHRKEVFHNGIKTCISNCFHTELHRGQHFHIRSSRYSREQAVFWWHHHNTVTRATTCCHGNHRFSRCWMPARLKTPFGDLLVKSLLIFDERSHKESAADAQLRAVLSPLWGSWEQSVWSSSQGVPGVIALLDTSLNATADRNGPEHQLCDLGAAERKQLLPYLKESPKM